MPPASTVAAISVRHLLEVVAQDGHAVEDILRPSGLAVSSLADPWARVPFSVAGQVWGQSIVATGDEHLGLRVGQALELGSFELFDYALSRSPTVGDAWHKAAAYFRAVADDATLEVVVEGSLARLEHTGSTPRVISELIMAAMFCAASRDSDRVLIPKEVRFRHPTPADPKRHRRFFGCDVRFGETCDALVVDEGVLRWPLRMADKGLASVLDSYLEEVVGRVPSGSLILRVQQYVLRDLHNGPPSLQKVAFKLGMSGRTLQRRLKEQGTTHQGVVDQARHELATQYLRDSHVSTTDVARMLGFSEASAFQRAFRRWTGTTPAVYRRR